MIVLFLPETTRGRKRVLVPFIKPVFFYIALAFRRIEEEGCGVYGDILSYCVILVKNKPAYINRMDDAIIAINRLRVVSLIS